MGSVAQNADRLTAKCSLSPAWRVFYIAAVEFVVLELLYGSAILHNWKLLTEVAATRLSWTSITAVAIVPSIGLVIALPLPIFWCYRTLKEIGKLETEAVNLDSLQRIAERVAFITVGLQLLLLMTVWGLRQL